MGEAPAEPLRPDGVIRGSRLSSGFALPAEAAGSAKTKCYTALRLKTDRLETYPTKGWPGLRLGEGPEEWACRARSRPGHSLCC